MGKNYQNTDLRGQSFVGQNLSGADFSGASLGGCDFSGAQLHGAEFCHARFGHDGAGWARLALLQLGMGTVAGVVTLVGIWYFLLMAGFFLKQQGWASAGHLSLFAMMLVLPVCALTVRAWQRQRFSGLLRGGVVLATLAGALAAGVAASGGVANQVAVAGAIARAGAIGAAVAASGAVVVAMAAAVLVAITGAGTGLAALLALAVCALLVVDGQDERLAVGLVCSIFPLVGMLVGRAARDREAPSLGLLRRLQIGFACIGGCNFAGADLAGANFSDSDLRHTRLRAAHLAGCRWQRARNLHLAQTRDTMLESLRVRRLLVNGVCDGRDFSGLDLSGGCFVGMNLAGCDFSMANLSGADFSACDLTEANLTQATALGTRFAGATMSGATILHWKIDPHTDLQSVICTHVWLGRDHTGKDVRNPPAGQFQEGEFSRRYRQIADTIEFAVHSRIELDALVAAIEQLKAMRTDPLQVQNLAARDDLLVVTIQTGQKSDAKTLYTELKQAYDTHLAQAQQTISLLCKQNDSLLELLKGRQHTLTVFNSVANNMDNSKRITNMIGNTVSQAMVNLGDHAANHNTMASEPTSPQLMQLLTELRHLIGNSQASQVAQADALR